MIDASTATAKDFDTAAQKHANAFWGWLIATGIVGFFFHWFAVIPAIFMILSIAKSLSSTSCADQLRKGTFRIVNPNNGAPDGDANNWNSNK